LIIICCGHPSFKRRGNYYELNFNLKMTLPLLILLAKLYSDTLGLWLCPYPLQGGEPFTLSIVSLCTLALAKMITVKGDFLIKMKYFCTSNERMR
jgi:hypothetical protein